MHLRRKGNDIEYIKTKDGYETDFFTRDKATGDVKLIQVCWDVSDKKTFERELRGLKSAMAEYAIASGTIVTWDEEFMIEARMQRSGGLNLARIADSFDYP